MKRITSVLVGLIASLTFSTAQAQNDAELIQTFGDWTLYRGISPIVNGIGDCQVSKSVADKTFIRIGFIREGAASFVLMASPDMGGVAERSLYNTVFKIDDGGWIPTQAVGLAARLNLNGVVSNDYALQIAAPYTILVEDLSSASKVSIKDPEGTVFTYDISGFDEAGRRLVECQNGDF